MACASIWLWHVREDCKIMARPFTEGAESSQKVKPRGILLEFRLVSLVWGRLRQRLKGLHLMKPETFKAKYATFNQGKKATLQSGGVHRNQKRSSLDQDLDEYSRSETSWLLVELKINMF